MVKVINVFTEIDLAKKLKEKFPHIKYHYHRRVVRLIFATIIEGLEAGWPVDLGTQLGKFVVQEITTTFGNLKKGHGNHSRKTKRVQFRPSSSFKERYSYVPPHDPVFDCGNQPVSAVPDEHTD
jgi:nucleoid DNA-binding protein